ncbi:CAAX prenyl protease 2 isoform X2 [Telopea speciosissima]|uniref:CAAX prenyl protease 2 isoform X2 n=1 Tax=Telopea speciosissima TaxID=54955 RepID=UPI001CC70EAB|nr:CAAX prenyl protease 2 isoform X2 [Telopea speciosissima]
MDKSQVGELPVFPSAEMEGYVPKSVAVIACTAMTIFYVAILYAPTLILRLPHPTSLNNFMIRRFVCAGISTIVSIFFCALILPMRRLEASSVLGAYGIRLDHLWHAVVIPISLTSLVYTGSLVSKFMSLLSSWNQHEICGEGSLSECVKIASQRFLERISEMASNVLVWRNYFVAPLTEELVFRACMIPLLLCGEFGTYKVMLLSPIFFSLAHLNHFLELYCQQKYTFIKASMIVGLQLCYTVIFGCYASFLFMRTGHLLAPIVAHIFCNMMGLPALSRRNKGLTSVAFVAGVAGFLWFLFPATHPDLYNDRTDSCRCWHGYCRWN